MLEGGKGGLELATQVTPPQQLYEDIVGTQFYEDIVGTPFYEAILLFIIKHVVICLPYP